MAKRAAREVSWHAGVDVGRLLNLLHEANRTRNLSIPERCVERKLRLFACGWCRYVRIDRQDGVCRQALEVAERFADGAATVADLADAHQPLLDRFNLHRAGLRTWERRERFAYAVTQPFAMKASSNAVSRPRQRGEPGVQLALLRDIFGNPFRSVAREPSWLTSTVASLARAIYEERAFDRMPVLGDALQDAGCDNDDILHHCRGDSPHVRGCWVVDLLLDKR